MLTVWAPLEQKIVKRENYTDKDHELAKHLKINKEVKIKSKRSIVLSDTTTLLNISKSSQKGEKNISFIN